MPALEFLAVAAAGVVLGGFAVPLGFWLGMSPTMVFVAAAGGGLLGCWSFLLVGDRATSWIRRRRGAGAGQEPARSTSAGDRSGRGRVLVDRYGVRGLGLVGPIFPGVTASVAAGLMLGLDRLALGWWMTAGVILLYGLYTVGVWFLLGSI
jgi:hypothetical protein